MSGPTYDITGTTRPASYWDTSPAPVSERKFSFRNFSSTPVGCPEYVNEASSISFFSEDFLNRPFKPLTFNTSFDNHSTNSSSDEVPVPVPVTTRVQNVAKPLPVPGPKPLPLPPAKRATPVDATRPAAVSTKQDNFWEKPFSWDAPSTSAQKYQVKTNSDPFTANTPYTAPSRSEWAAPNLAASTPTDKKMVINGKTYNVMIMSDEEADKLNKGVSNYINNLKLEAKLEKQIKKNDKIVVKSMDNVISLLKKSIKDLPKNSGYNKHQLKEITTEIEVIIQECITYRDDFKKCDQFDEAYRINLTTKRAPILEERVLEIEAVINDIIKDKDRKNKTIKKSKLTCNPL